MAEKHIPSAQHDAWVLGMCAIVGVPALAAFWVTTTLLGPNHLSLSLYHSHLPTWSWLGLFGVIWTILVATTIDSLKRVKRLGLPSLVAASGKGSELEVSRTRLPWWSKEMKERYGVPVDRLVVGITKGNRFRITAKDSGLLICGGPRTGKSVGLIVPNLLLWDGPIVSTSTKPEILRDTLGRRRELGRVLVWDLFQSLPPYLEPQVTRISYPLPKGCESYSLALKRGESLTGKNTPGVDPHWRIRAGQVVASLLHAAALSSTPTTATVMTWLHSHDLTTPINVIRSAGGDPSSLEVLASLQGAAGEELKSIFSTAAGTLKAFDDPAIRKAEAVGSPLDFTQFLGGGSDSLYLICPDSERRAAASLFLVLLDDLHRAVIANSSPRKEGRLAKSLFVCLDEMCNVAPIDDLESWVSALPGHGVTVAGVVQDMGQIRERYGQAIAEAAPTLFNTTCLFGGSRDADYLTSLETITGAGDLAQRRASGQPIPEHLASGDRLTIAELAGMSRHQLLVMAAHTEPKKVRAIFWPKVEPFASWGTPSQTSGSGEQFKLVMGFRNRLRLPKPVLVDDSGVPAIASGNEFAPSTSVQDSHAPSVSRDKSTLVRDCPQQLVEYEITSEKQPTDEEKPKPLDEAWRERFEPIELVPLKPLGGAVADPLDSEPPLPLAKPPRALWEPQAPIPGTDKNRWPGLCEKCSYRVAPGGGRVSRGGAGWLTWDLDCYRERFSSSMSSASGDATH